MIWRNSRVERRIEEGTEKDDSRGYEYRSVPQTNAPFEIMIMY
jgi:hypothetical protein